MFFQLVAIVTKSPRKFPVTGTARRRRRPSLTKQRTRLAMLALIAASGLSSCTDASRPQAAKLNGTAMGTSYNVTIVTPSDDERLTTLRREIEDELERIETLASTYRPDSELSILNRAPADNWVPVSNELCHLLHASFEVSRQTGGAFDPTIGAVVNLWGFGPEPSAPDSISDADIEMALRSTGTHLLTLDCERSQVKKTAASLYIDLSAWAKGHAVDRLAATIAASGLVNFLVEIGGEIRVSGLNADNKPYFIGIEQPIAGAAAVNNGIRVTNAGIATSGSYRNFREVGDSTITHVIDPATGRPINHKLVSVTVIGESVAEADAIATALLVLGPEKGLRFATDHKIAAYFIVADKDDFETLQTAEFESAIVPASFVNGAGNGPGESR